MMSVISQLNMNKAIRAAFLNHKFLLQNLNFTLKLQNDLLMLILFLLEADIEANLHYCLPVQKCVCYIIHCAEIFLLIKFYDKKLSYFQNFIIAHICN